MIFRSVKVSWGQVQHFQSLITKKCVFGILKQVCPQNQPNQLYKLNLDIKKYVVAGHLFWQLTKEVNDQTVLLNWLYLYLLCSLLV